MPEKSYTIVQDGNAWCCYNTNTFINLQESECAFADTPVMALEKYILLYEHTGKNVLS